MSLFGDFPDDPPARTKQSNTLFDENRPAAARSTSSLFADDADSGAESPWAFPTPKKAGRAQLVKNLLPASEVPEAYVDLFDQLITGGDRLGAGVSLNGVKRVLEQSGFSADVKARILAVVLPAGEESNDGIGRGEFAVLLALIGLAQEGEDVTLDGVDERRRNLPIPSLASMKVREAAKTDESESNVEPTQAPATPAAQRPESVSTTPSRTANVRKESFGYDADPWGSPDLHRGHNHTATNGSAPPVNGTTNTAAPPRTTSNFTTSSHQPDSIHDRTSSRPQQSADSTWGAYAPSSNDSFRDSGLGGGPGSGGFDGNGPGSNEPPGLGRSNSTPRPVPSGVEEIIQITAIAEKEGMFMFQHRNYQVTSARRNSKVIRRYSDFVWLLDCLHKRYPFRQLPLLPPKRVAINGNYLAADASFVEKRRRGLARFANTLVRHPVLSQEQLVIMFLTVPTELSVWRKQANLSVQEEFTGKSLPPHLEDSLPANLQDLFDRVRTGVKRSADIYINLCNLLERLTKRNEGIAAEYLRFSLALQSLTEISQDTFAVETNDVPLLNEGMNATAKHLSSSQSLLEDEAKAWDEGVLEDLKKQRDCLVSVRDMFERRDRYDKDNIPQLERRISSNEQKLVTLRGKPEGLVKPGEIEKVEDAILRDKQSIVAQHARGVFVKECIRDELHYFQHSQYAISRLHQDWAQERVKYAELQADCWRSLSEQVESMPLGE